MFQVGKPVTGLNLIGRENELKLIKHLLISGQSVAIIAPRRFGKTSLILELLEQFKSEQYFTNYIDLFSTPDINEFSKRITENVLANNKLDKAFRNFGHQLGEIISNISFRQEIEDFNFILQYQEKKSSTDWELLEKSIDFIEDYSIKYKKHTLTAFDEFGDIQKLDGDEIVKLFRSKIQMQKQTSYLFCGSYESIMDKLFVSSKSPFYRLTRIINLGYIDKELFSQHMKNELNKHGLADNSDTIKDILNFTEGHPYYSQLFLQEAIIQAALENKSEILNQKNLSERLLLVEKNYLEKTWEELSKSREDRLVITSIVKFGDNLYSRLHDKKINVARSLKKLKGRGIILNDVNGIKLTDPLFNYWIKKNILRIDE
ncbi:MAG: ATP-binding protein [Candidatus Marinimicrobia bacterium]|nr:ATP-binding protein [Candidatus Neomarinimicrobiota bacterium]